MDEKNNHVGRWKFNQPRPPLARISNASAVLERLAQWAPSVERQAVRDQVARIKEDEDMRRLELQRKNVTLRRQSQRLSLMGAPS